MSEIIPLISKVFLRFKKEWLILAIFISIVTLSQAIILKPHLEFGFTPDDVWLFSDFSALEPNPFSKILMVYQQAGPHVMSPLYYNGILFSLFEFNFQFYQIAALIFKILSVISLYILVQILFRNRLLSFSSGLISSFHYGSVGSMEMVTRTQDYLVLTGINIFLIFFYLIFLCRLKNILWSILTSGVLFVAFFINPIRAYPIIPFICFLGAALFLKDRSWPNFYRIAKHLSVIFLPFILFLFFQGSGGVFYHNSITIIEKVSVGNLQMLIAPFSSFGSLFLQNDVLRFLSSPTWALNDFLDYFLEGPLIIFGVTTFILSKILSRKPLIFFLGVLVTNFLLEFLFFLAINTGKNLPENLRMSYDAYSFTSAAVLGGYILVLTAFIFIEWLKNKHNKMLTLYLLGIIFSVTFIWFTWIVYSVVHIPMGIYGYSTIPSMGVSLAISSILVLAYQKINSQRNFLKVFAPSVFLIFVIYFFYNNYQIQIYLKENQNYGNKASDQIYLKDRFWSFLKK